MIFRKEINDFSTLEPPLGKSAIFLKEVYDLFTVQPPLGNQSILLGKSMISSLSSLLQEIDDFP